MIKKVLALSIFLFLLIYSTASSYQFEDYKWGTSYDENLREIIASGKKILDKDDNAIMYSDKILNSTCDVTLQFTPKSKLLASVTVFWETETVGEDLKEMLTKKYGQPAPYSISGHYFWVQGGEKINLKYIGNTVCIYFGGIYWDKYEKEKSEINSTDASRF